MGGYEKVGQTPDGIPIKVKRGKGPKKPSLAERGKAWAKKVGKSALSNLPTGYGVSTEKKGVLRGKDTFMKES